ncbi:MAG TPA: hypothetical protein VH436_36240 [Vicinamibacterales bacterium]
MPSMPAGTGLRFASVRRWLFAAVIGAACIFATGVGSAHDQAVQIPKEATALEGRPSVMIDVTAERAERRTLRPAEIAAHRLEITIENGHYFWASRNNEPLTLRSAGEFTYLSSSEPGQYIRFTRFNRTLTYVEHVDMAFGSVTYVGELRIVMGR